MAKLPPNVILRDYPVSQETPREHIANALTILYAMRADNVRTDNDDMCAVIARLERAVLQLDGATPV